MLSSIKKLINILFGKEDSGGDVVNGGNGGGLKVETPKPLTNQEVIDKVFEIYKSQLKADSTRRTMLYPTFFRIYLHTFDFSAVQSYFDAIAKDLASDFNEFNRGEMHNFTNNKPSAKFWQFQFIEILEKVTVEGLTNTESGNVYTVSSRYSQVVEKNTGDVNNVGNETSITMTVTPKNSVIHQKLNNINIDAILGMEILENNKFTIPIHENYEDVAIKPKEEKPQPPPVHSEALAYLICDKNFISGTQRGNKYNMTTNILYISGKNDTRVGAQFAKVDHPLPDNILQIKHENGRFFLAAFSRVRLNQALVTESTGNDLKWDELSNKSKILVSDGAVSLEFIVEKK